MIILAVRRSSWRELYSWSFGLWTLLSSAQYIWQRLCSSYILQFRKVRRPEPSTLTTYLSFLFT